MSEKKYGKVPPQSVTAMIFLWIIFALNANGRELLSRIMPSMVDEFDLDPMTASYLTFAMLFAIGIGSVPIAAWVDRGGKGYARKYRHIIVSACCLLPIFFVGFSFISASFLAVAVLMVFRSVFSGAGESIEVGTLDEWIPRERTGIFLGTQHAGYPWGTLIGGIAASAVLSTFGNENWRYVFFIFPVIAAVVWIFWWRFSNEKNYKRFQENTRDSGYTLPLDVKAGGEVQEHRKGALGRCVKNPNIMSMSILAFLFCSTYYGFAFMQTPLLSFSLGYSYASSAFLSTIITITGGIFTIVWGSVSDRVGTKKIMMICALWLCVCFLLYTQAGLGLWAVVTFQLLFGVCANAVYGVIYTIVGVSCEKGDAVTATGFTIMGMYVGAGVGALVVGKLVELGGGWESIQGYNAALVTFAVVLAVAFVVIILFTRETSGKKRGKDFALVSLESCNIFIDNDK